MKQFFYLSAFCILTLAACKGGFKKAGNGLEYKIISVGSGAKPVYGDYIQMHIKNIYNGTKDTVLGDTHESMPKIQMFDSARTPLEYFKIMSQLRIGDSVVIKVLTDSAFAKAPNGMPAFIKKGKFIYTHIKLVNIFKDMNAVDSANKAEYFRAKPIFFKKQLTDIETELAKEKDQLAKDTKTIEDYLAKNNIKATKTKWGTYISTITEGTGEKITNDHIVTVNYTGKTLDSGKVFDSNVDPKFQHVQPYELNMNEVRGVILGWTDALLQLRKGSKAVIFIPSTLAYGKQGRDQSIKPGDCLIFEMEIKDVTTEQAMLDKQEKMQQEMVEKERLRIDSLEKAAKK